MSRLPQMSKILVVLNSFEKGRGAEAKPPAVELFTRNNVDRWKASMAVTQIQDETEEQSTF